MNDFYNWPVAIAFDSSDNLYVYDANRGQVRIYKTPFSYTTPTPTQLTGDITEDGIVDLDDFNMFVENFGKRITGNPPT